MSSTFVSPPWSCRALPTVHTDINCCPSCLVKYWEKHKIHSQMRWKWKIKCLVKICKNMYLNRNFMPSSLVIFVFWFNASLFHKSQNNARKWLTKSLDFKPLIQCHRPKNAYPRRVLDTESTSIISYFFLMYYTAYDKIFKLPLIHTPAQ